jgi:hypothetical protein
VKSCEREGEREARKVEEVGEVLPECEHVASWEVYIGYCGPHVKRFNAPRA